MNYDDWKSDNEPTRAQLEERIAELERAVPEWPDYDPTDQDTAGFLVMWLSCHPEKGQPKVATRLLCQDLTAAEVVSQQVLAYPFGWKDHPPAWVAIHAPKGERWAFYGVRYSMAHGDGG